DREIFQRVALEALDGEHRELLPRLLFVGGKLGGELLPFGRAEHAGQGGDASSERRDLQRSGCRRQAQPNEHGADAPRPVCGNSRHRRSTAGAFSSSGAASKVWRTSRSRKPAPMLVGTRWTTLLYSATCSM